LALALINLPLATIIVIVIIVAIIIIIIAIPNSRIITRIHSSVHIFGISGVQTVIITLITLMNSIICRLAGSAFTTASVVL